MLPRSGRRLAADPAASHDDDRGAFGETLTQREGLLEGSQSQQSFSRRGAEPVAINSLS